jgi:ferredoxin
VAEEFAERLQDLDLELHRDVSEKFDYQRFQIKFETTLFSEGLFHSRFMPDISILTDKCSRCGTCVKRCPVQIIDLVGIGPPSRSTRRGTCIHCGECYFKCPEKAVIYEAAKFESHLAKVAVHTPSGEVEPPGNTCVIA